ncbi:MAG: CotH kinase family protein, partial [Lachnospiraceae bacterium]|nr:CotH kinase family protein [Lachnospiraceae bacterium]
MLLSKKIDRICIIITVLTLILTVVFMGSSCLGIHVASGISFNYEKSLFDDSYVHTIDIVTNDWDTIIKNAESEEYSAVDVTIDGETVKNVGLRAKGNTSLRTVKQMNSERYSFKIEFDCYNKGGNYEGLDKLCLNNLIQDYTMMKDYLAYKLMGDFGADAPLCSFCYITVNGEDWGLYLAVESVEDSFLERNYGTNHGELYKPDSMGMGGGRGNGKGFDIENFDFGSDFPGFNKDGNGDGNNSFTPPSGDGNGNFTPPSMESSSAESRSAESRSSESREDNRQRRRGEDSENRENRGNFPGGENGDRKGGPGGGGPGMGSSDTKLVYSDDNLSSYSSIFGNAKTSANSAAKARLINSLKNLNEGATSADAGKIKDSVDIEEVLRYMVVHNFVVNGDSYTGSMIHNYYLYEEDGKLSMIPWDYNLAYGTFQGKDASASVNDPIDTPLSITDTTTDRPMFTWITAIDEYKEEYHNLYSQFIEKYYTSGYLQELVTKTSQMISSYVEKDPTKFCTYENYQKAVETMKAFLDLRCRSIKGQLEGTIPTTDSGQTENSSNLIDASSITLSDMGSMGGGMGGG